MPFLSRYHSQYLEHTKLSIVQTLHFVMWLMSMKKVSTTKTCKSIKFFFGPTLWKGNFFLVRSKTCEKNRGFDARKQMLSKITSQNPTKITETLYHISWNLMLMLLHGILWIFKDSWSLKTLIVYIITIVVSMLKIRTFILLFKSFGSLLFYKIPT